MSDQALNSLSADVEDSKDHMKAMAETLGDIRYHLERIADAAEEKERDD